MTLPDDVHGGRVVLLLVHTHHEHGCVGRRRRDDDLLGTTLDVQTSLVDAREAASRLDDILGTISAPRDLLRVTAAGRTMYNAIVLHGGSGSTRAR